MSLWYTSLAGSIVDKFQNDGTIFMTAQANSTAQKLAKVFTVGGFSSIACFMMQRIVTWKSLGLETLPSDTLKLQAQITGLLADVWAGVIVAMLTLVFITLVPVFRRHCFVSYPLFLGIFLFVLCLHIPYVEYFGSMISLAHFKYLVDPDFVKAGSANLTDSRLWAISLGCLLLMPLSYLGLRKHKSPIVLAVAVFLLGVLSQVSKVQLNTKKVGWKTPKILAVSPIEYVFVQVMESKDLRPASLNDAELFLLREHRGSDQFSLKQILEGDVRGAETPLGLQLKKNIQERIAANVPVTLFVVLLESVRPEESRFFTPANPVSYTPFLDELAQSGVAYTQAYTAGAVTRSGQEAALCGLLTGEMTSAMRNLLTLNPQCLPQHLKNKFGPAAFASWWHAGDFNFDSQGTFWARHGVDFMTSRKDFAPNTPSSFWGISDFSLVEKLRTEILTRTPNNTLVAQHTFLSVTNHADWGFPEDTPAELSNQEKSVAHVSFITTRYTDDALKKLVEVLHSMPCLKCESQSLWDSSVFVVVNDHGNLLPSQLESKGHTFGISNTLDISAANVVSRAALVVSGGLVQSALRQLNKTNEVDSRPVSQVDIFATLGNLIDERMQTVGDSLFATHRRWPVIVDLGNNIYFPELLQSPTRVFPRNDLLKASDSLGDYSNRDFYLSKTFFRAYQSLLMAGDAGR